MCLFSFLEEWSRNQNLETSIMSHALVLFPISSSYPIQATYKTEYRQKSQSPNMSLNHCKLCFLVDLFCQEFIEQIGDDDDDR
jgi:hypothetical protein